MARLIDMLRNSTWGRNLTPSEFDRVARETREAQVIAGGYVARNGELVEHWIGIVEGLAKMSVTSAEGKVSTLTGVTAGGWFGEGSVLKKEARRYDVVALRDTRIAMMPRVTFDWLRTTSIPFNHYLLNLLNARLGLFIGLLEYDRLLGPDARVARCLASLFNPDLYPQPGPYVDLLQGEVGLLSGVSRQRANVALQRLQEAGLLRIDPRGLTVLDLDGLRRFAGGR
ncbi:Crp/Fnr family transcriptional regulator [Schlegelella sp. S2-27]|uniref:Crp/Fnr family transcriptional regulator n=1 Tax=Caldimonas mangrovi TaxID=2944811 RepID=A0ABT0YRN6_9BURK|nr:Crp/Fnr family transcriptional regulator [Caldimonas mangrovi]MCM5681387.1 Crp/Fnr family transcriptional regulator [Caldimonas mangrovi]